MNKQGLRLCCLEQRTVSINNVWLWFSLGAGKPALLVSVPKSLLGSTSVLLMTSFTPPPNDLGFLSAAGPQMSWGTRPDHLQLVWHSGVGGLLWHWRWSITVQASSDQFSMLPITWDANQHHCLLQKQMPEVSACIIQEHSMQRTDRQSEHLPKKHKQCIYALAKR